MAMPPAVALPAVVQTARWIARPGAYLDAIARDYGDVVQANFAPLGSIVLTSNLGHVKAIFTAPPADVPTATSTSPLRALVGEHSLLTLSGPAHMRQRKLLLPPFHGDRLRSYQAVIEAAATREIGGWRVGDELAVKDRMARITLDVILRAVFGVEDGARHQTLGAAITEVMELSGSLRSVIPAIRAVRTGKLSGPIKGPARRMDAELYAEIAAHRADPGLADRQDILSMLVRARDEDGQPMTDIELRDELVTLLVAGHETTATSAAWAIERLLRTPHALARLTDDLDDDAYFDAVIAEVLRNRPVVPIVGRLVQRPFSLDPYLIPTGTFIAANLYGANHDASVYDEPFAFRPERFLDRKPDPYAWIPFGGGVRRCIGAAFAQMELKVILRTLLSTVQLAAIDPASEPIRRRNVTLVPKYGAAVRVTAVNTSRGRHAVGSAGPTTVGFSG